MAKTNMQLTSETASDFWNDSSNIKELSEAIKQGAVGATSNPVIVYNAIKAEAGHWLSYLDKLIEDNKEDSEDEIAWKLIEMSMKEAAKLLEPAFKKHNGLKGRLSAQVNPKFYRNAAKMVEHAVRLSSLAPNIAIKAPVTEAGLGAIEEMTARGIVVNGTVCFTVAQAIACAEAIERGFKRAAKDKVNTDKMTPYVTIMIGRLDDQLTRAMTRDRINIDPGYLEWSGIAAFKKAYKIFQERSYRGTLLAAAFRNYMQWYELVGGKIVMTIPYRWWTRFNTARIDIRSRIDEPVDQKIVDELYAKFEDFRKGYDEDGMKPADFIHFGGSVHTIMEFISGYSDLLAFVRERMLR